MNNSTETRKTIPAAISEDSAISLKIAGADLLLSGRFNHWQPLGVSGWTDGRATAHLLFDVTSTSARASRRRPDLLSFAAKTVERVSDNRYEAKGTLRADGVARAADAVIQTPGGHSPFFTVTLGLERESFSGLWMDLQVRAAQVPANDGAEMRPRAWLRVPELAAA